MTSERMTKPEQERLWELFHHLWSRDVGTNGYSKALWTEMEGILFRAMKTESDQSAGLTQAGLTQADVADLEPGLYSLRWVGGGESYAAIGCLHDGSHWYAPVNWVNFGTKAPVAASIGCTDWSKVSMIYSLAIDSTRLEKSDAMGDTRCPSSIKDGGGHTHYCAFHRGHEGSHERRGIRWEEPQS